MRQATRKLNFWLYRITTVLKSFKTLYSLPPEKIEAFLNSYNVYNYDWANEKEMREKLGPDYHQKINQGIVDYYCVLNHLCSIGQVEKMYIPPAVDLSKSIIENQRLIERRMAHDLGLNKGSKGLDLGCGRGKVSSHVASLTGAHMTGINLDPDQLETARRFAYANNLEKQCDFRQGDINDLPLPFADNSLDAVYEIQVIFSLSKDLLKLLKEIHRVLKPGGRLACLDWVSLNAYNPKDPHHADLLRRVKPLIGAIGTLPVDKVTDLLKQAGFEIVVSEIPSVDGLQAPLIDKADKFFTGLTRVIHFLVKCKVLPKHFRSIFDRFTLDGQALVEADRMRLVTTTYYFVAQKKGESLNR
jgi:sterol 24-C-methyltransferase